MLLRISKRRVSVEKIFLYYLHAGYQQKNMVYDNIVKSISDADRTPFTLRLRPELVV